MAIRYVRGDATEASQVIILHGCNDAGRMGSGIAKTIKAKFPEAYETYRRVYEQNENSLELGKIVWAHISPTRIIGNAITQHGYGNDGGVYVDYDAIRKCIQRANAKCLKRKFVEFALPRIGAGLGGGRWDLIEQIIRDETTDCTAVVYDL